MLALKGEENSGKADFPRRLDSVAFEKVSFSYREGQPVLKDISFELHPSQIYAIIGESGIGKTTLIDLLMRFYNPERGKITVNGWDIDTHPQEIKKIIGVQLQAAQNIVAERVLAIGFGGTAGCGCGWHLGGSVGWTGQTHNLASGSAIYLTVFVDGNDIRAGYAPGALHLTHTSVASSRHAGATGVGCLVAKGAAASSAAAANLCAFALVQNVPEMEAYP